MSAGLSFGALPSFADLSPDQQAMLMQALQQPGQPANAPQGAPVGLLGQMDPQGSPPPGAPGLGDLMRGGGQGGPSVAMSEADTRRLERQMASPQDLAALGGSPADQPLYDRSGMGGGANPFVRGPGQVGTAGSPDTGPIDQRDPSHPGASQGARLPDPQATGSVGADGSRLVPLPPQRPSDLSVAPSGMNPGMPQGQTVASSTAVPGPAPNQYLPAPASPTGADPSRGPMTAPSVGMPPGAVSPSATAQATGQAGGTGGGSLLERFANRLNNPDVGNLLLNVGMGLMSQRGFGPGITAGLQGYQASNLSNVKQQLEQYKLMQTIQGQQAQRNYLIKTKGLSPDAADALIANPTLLSNQLAQEKPNYQTVGGNIYDLNRNGGVPGQGNLVGPASGPPAGFEADPTTPGQYRPIAGGPATPEYKGSVAGAEAKAKSDAVPDKPIQVRPGAVVLDPNTMKPLYEAPGNKPQGFETEDKLRTEFSKQLGTFGQVHDGYGRVIAATKQRQDNPGTPSPASDIGLIFGYMKMLDPGSVVREGEYATAKNATGVPERVLNAYNKALNGEFLSDAQRKDFLGQAAELYGTSRKTAEGVADRYRGLAQQYGVSPERSVYLPDMPTPPRIGQQSQAPQPPAPAARYQQLRQGGLSAADAHARMLQEGF